MVEAKQKILIVENDLDVANMLNAYFRVLSYDTVAVQWGEEAVRTCLASPPDIVILDIRLPGIDGYEVKRRLRSNHRTSSIPIIFLVEKNQRFENQQVLELGADDYITKPFDVQELRLRIRNSLRRAKQDSLTNPVTGLPDEKLVDERICHCLDLLDWTMLVVSLENLDDFRKKYGFVASDDVLRAVSMMLQGILKELGGQDDFLGHLGTAEFLVITSPDRVNLLKERLRNRLEQSLDYFYPIKDRKKLASHKPRLLVKIGVLQAGDAQFTSMDDLKLSLLRKKR